MPGRTWTRETVIHAIRSEAALGHPLHYSSVDRRAPSLLRAAERVFGTWGAAIEAAGFDYSTIRRYRRWTRDLVIERIQEWHRKGADLSWRHVATVLDPSLAAATLHAFRFPSWNDALLAAGIDPAEVARYRRWHLPLIEQELDRLMQQGIAVDQETLMTKAPDLRAAIYRIPGGVEAQRRALHRQLEGRNRYFDHDNDPDRLIDIAVDDADDNLALV